MSNMDEQVRVINGLFPTEVLEYNPNEHCGEYKPPPDRVDACVLQLSQSGYLAIEGGFSSGKTAAAKSTLAHVSKADQTSLWLKLDGSENMEPFLCYCEQKASQFGRIQDASTFRMLAHQPVEGDGFSEQTAVDFILRFFANLNIKYVVLKRFDPTISFHVALLMRSIPSSNVRIIAIISTTSESSRPTQFTTVAMPSPKSKLQFSSPMSKADPVLKLFAALRRPINIDMISRWLKNEHHNRSKSLLEVTVEITSHKNELIFLKRSAQARLFKKFVVKECHEEAAKFWQAQLEPELLKILNNQGYKMLPFILEPWQFGKKDKSKVGTVDAMLNQPSVHKNLKQRDILIELIWHHFMARDLRSMAAAYFVIDRSHFALAHRHNYLLKFLLSLKEAKVPLSHQLDFRIARVYKQQGSYILALKALESMGELNHEISEAVRLQIKAEILIALGNYPDALEALNRSNDLYMLPSVNDYKGLGRGKFCEGIIALQQKRPDLALECFEAAAKAAQSVGFYRGRSLRYKAAARVKLDQKEAAQAELNEAMNLLAGYQSIGLEAYWEIIHCLYLSWQISRDSDHLHRAKALFRIYCSPTLSDIQKLDSYASSKTPVSLPSDLPDVVADQLQNSMHVNDDEVKLYNKHVLIDGTWIESETMVYFVDKKTPINSGGFKCVFRIFDLTSEAYGSVCVAKKFLQKKTLKEAKQEVQDQLDANLMGHEFATKLKAAGFKIPALHYLAAWVIEDLESHEYFIVEPFIKEYEWWHQNQHKSHPLEDTAAAFTHFSVTESKGEIMIRDLQGWGGEIFTDPMIVRDSRQIQTFLARHSCNQYCHALNLPKPRVQRIQ